MPTTEIINYLLKDSHVINNYNSFSRDKQTRI